MAGIGSFHSEIWEALRSSSRVTREARLHDRFSSGVATCSGRGDAIRAPALRPEHSHPARTLRPPSSRHSYETAVYCCRGARFAPNGVKTALQQVKTPRGSLLRTLVWKQSKLA